MSSVSYFDSKYSTPNQKALIIKSKTLKPLLLSMPDKNPHCNFPCPKNEGENLKIKYNKTSILMQKMPIQITLSFNSRLN